jgi:glycosyltransferase involved in cell wall biosynthesis
MKLAIVGTRGLPNNYGGFETLAEYLVEYLAQDFEITVFCSSIDLPTKLKEFNGAKLAYVPVTSHGALGIIYDSISILQAIRKFDKILILGFGCGFVAPFLKKKRSQLIVNIGGLDWKRDKWSSFAKKVIKKAESHLLQNSGTIISDNKGIQDYIEKEYGLFSTFIAYGGDQVRCIPINIDDSLLYPFLTKKYAFIVTRIQVDNNIEMMLEAFTNQNILPLIIVGNWDNSEYGIGLKKKYLNKTNIVILDAIYDRKKLDLLRSNCYVYIHGHSAGGTNPSLTEAMYLGLPIFAYASGYNENTTFHKAKYFKTQEELTKLIIDNDSIELEKIGRDLKEIANLHYRWGNIAEAYKNVILNS